MRVAQHDTSVTLIGLVIVMTLGCDRSRVLPTGPTATGAIHITVSTEGASSDIDPDGYGVMVDGKGPMVIGVQGALTIDYLVPASHFVNLTDLASNCAVAPNEQWVDVAAGGLAELAYKVECNPIPPEEDCGWDCYYWSQSAQQSSYDIVSTKGRDFTPVRSAVR